MKKKLLIMGLLIASASICYSQQLQITFKVVDDFNAPVADAAVNLFTYQTTKAGEGFGEDVYQKATGTTDTNGMVTLTGSTSHADIKYGVTPKDGYYYTEPTDYQFKEPEGGRWQPSNPVVKIMLRPIIKPIPMYAGKIEARIAKPTEVYGYDLVLRDWVAPAGKGKTADLFFELTGYANNVTDYGSTLIVSFTNTMDGIQPFEAIDKSAFRSPREAPLDGYQNTMELRRVRNQRLSSSQWVDDTARGTNYIFRIRTMLDENGKIKSALYGKIYGGIKFFGASTNGSFLTIPACYLNPIPNSRNMEFDPRQNLYKNLPSLESSIAP